MNKMSLLKNYKSILFTAILCLVSIALFAQDFDYLQEAYKSVADGDCQKAQKLYNVYKAMENKDDIGLEELIKECQSPSKQYRIGDMIEIDGNRYPIAYIDVTGQHGWAIAEIEKRYVFSKKKETKKEKDFTMVYYPFETEVVNKEVLPQKYDEVTEDDLLYVFNNKELIGINPLGKFCLSTVDLIIDVEQAIDRRTLSITRTATITDYEFSFFDFISGGTEQKRINTDFKTRAIVKINF